MPLLDTVLPTQAASTEFGVLDAPTGVPSRIDELEQQQLGDNKQANLTESATSKINALRESFIDKKYRLGETGNEPTNFSEINTTNPVRNLGAAAFSGTIAVAAEILDMPGNIALSTARRSNDAIFVLDREQEASDTLNFLRQAQERAVANGAEDPAIGLRIKETEDKLLKYSDILDGYNLREGALASKQVIDTVLPVSEALDSAKQYWADKVDRTNQDKIVTIASDVGKDISNALDQGDYLEAGVIGLLGIVETVATEPVGAVELFTESLPRMILAAKKLPTAFVSLAATYDRQTYEAFVAEHGREPDANEQSNISLSAIVGSMADTLSDVMFLKGGAALNKTLAKINQAAPAVGQTINKIIAPVISTRIGSLTATAAKQATFASAQLGQEFISGATTEAAAQFGVQQDLSKLDTAEIATQGVIEAVAVGPVQGARLAKAATVEGTKALLTPLAKRFNRTTDSLFESGKEALKGVDTPGAAFFRQATESPKEEPATTEADTPQTAPEVAPEVDVNDAVEDVTRNPTYTQKARITIQATIAAKTEQVHRALKKQANIPATTDKVAEAVTAFMDKNTPVENAEAAKNSVLFAMITDDGTTVDTDTAQALLDSGKLNAQDTEFVQTYTQFLDRKKLVDVTNEIQSGTGQIFIGYNTHAQIVANALIQNNENGAKRALQNFSVWADKHTQKLAAFEQVAAYNAAISSEAGPRPTAPNLPGLIFNKSTKLISSFKPYTESKSFTYTKAESFNKLRTSISNEVQTLQFIHTALSNRVDNAFNAPSEVTEATIPPLGTVTEVDTTTPLEEAIEVPPFLTDAETTLEIPDYITNAPTSPIEAVNPEPINNVLPLKPVLKGLMRRIKDSPLFPERVVDSLFTFKSRRDAPLHAHENYMAEVINNPQVVPEVHRKTVVQMAKFTETFAKKFTEIDEIETGASPNFSYKDTIGDTVKSRSNPLAYFYEQVVTGKTKNGKDIIKGRLDPNIKSAIGIAAMTWLTNDARNTLFNDDSSINSLLGEPTNAPIKAEHVYLRDVGTHLTRAATNLGQTVLRDTGIQVDATTAEYDTKVKLATAIGLQALTTLEQLGYVTISPVELPNQRSRENPLFIRLQDTITRGQHNYAPTQGYLKFKESLGEIADVDAAMEELFKTERPTSFPGFKVGKKYEKGTTFDQGQTVSDNILAAMNHGRRQPWQFKPEMETMLRDLVSLQPKVAEKAKQFFRTVQGYDFDQANAPLYNKENIRSKNLGIDREIDNVGEFYKRYLKNNRDPFYFDYTSQSNTRMRTNNSSFSYQSSKLVRHIIAHQTWLADDPVYFNNPYTSLALEEGLGGATDSPVLEASTKDARQNTMELIRYRKMPIIAAALAALKKGEYASPAVITAINTYGKGANTLAALMLLNDSTNTKKDAEGNEYFLTNAGIELDAKTSGVGLGALQSDDHGLVYAQLNAAGILTNNAPNLHHHLKIDNNADNYGMFLQKLQINLAKADNEENYTAFTALMGGFVRDDAKPMVMQSNYSAGAPKLITNFIENIVIEIHNKLKTNPEEAISFLSRTVGLDIQPSFDVTKEKLSAQQLRVLNTFLTGMLAEPLEQTIEASLPTKPFYDKLNRAMNLLFILYNTEYRAVRAALAERVAAGEIVTVEEYNKLFEDKNSLLYKLRPLVSSASASTREEGIYAASTKRRAAQFNGKVQVFHANTLTAGRDSKSTSGIYQETVYDYPGVSGVVNLIQSMDANAISRVFGKKSMMAIHDAMITSLNAIQDTGTTYNQGILDMATDYSVAEAVSAALEESIQLFTTGKKGATQLLNEAFLADKQAMVDETGSIGITHSTFQTYAKEQGIESFEIVTTIRNELRQAVKAAKESKRKLLENDLKVMDHLNDANSAITIEKADSTPTKITKLSSTLMGDITRNIGDTLGSATNPDLDNFNATNIQPLTADTVLPVYETLENLSRGSTLTTDTAHDTTLRNVMTNLVQKVFRTIDTHELKLRTEGDTVWGAQRGTDVFVNMAQRSANTLVGLTPKEVYTHELVHISTKAGLADYRNYGTYREIQQLMQKTVTDLNAQFNGEGWRIFLQTDANGDIKFKVDEQAEKDAAKKLFDYIFNNNKTVTVTGRSTDGSTVSRKISVGINEFIAYGLTNKKLNDFLGTTNTQAPLRDVKAGPLAQRLWHLFLNILDTIQNRISRSRNMKSDAALFSMAQDVAYLHENNMRLTKMWQKYDNLNPALSDAWSAAILNPLRKWNKKKWHTARGTNSTFKKTRALGHFAAMGILGIPDAQEKEQYMDAMDTARRNLGIARDGIISQIVSEIGHLGSLTYKRLEHVLLRSKHELDGTRKRIADSVTLNISRNFRVPITDELQWSALTYGLMKTRLGTVYGAITAANYTTVLSMLTDTTARQARIADITTQVATQYGREGNFMSSQARSLGQYMATGRAGVKEQLLNTTRIANLETLARLNVAHTPIPEAAKQELIPLLDELVSLSAVDNTHNDMRQMAGETITREFDSNGIENGITFFSALLKDHDEVSLERNFDSDPTLQTQGHIKQLLDPYVGIFMSDIDAVAEHAELEKKGYINRGFVPTDSSDTTGQPKLMFVNPVGGLSTRERFIMSVTNEVAAGSEITVNASTILANNRKDVLAQMGNATYSSPAGNHLVPIPTPSGRVDKYRYTMKHSVREEVLKQNLQAHQLLGTMHAAIEDKVMTKQINKATVDILHADFEENFTKMPSEFVTISAAATDPEQLELYRLMPKDTRDYANDKFSGGMLVRRELLDIVFGRSKISLAGKLGNKVGHTKALRIAETLLTDLVQMGKRGIVLKTISVLKNNIISNTIIGTIRGVPPTWMLQKQAEGASLLYRFQKDNSQLDRLRIAQKVAKQTDPVLAAELQEQITLLKAEIAINPIAPLIDAGLFQTIVDDIETQETNQNLMEQYLDQVKDWTSTVTGIRRDSRIGRGIKTATDIAFITQDTTAYKLLSKTTQYSDFVSRYAMYTYKVGVKKEDPAKVLDTVIKTYINYETPTNKWLQYMNDTGFAIFSKYPLRILQVVKSTLQENPANFLSFLALEQFFHTNWSDPSDSVTSLPHILGTPDSLIGAATAPYGINHVTDAF